MHKYGYSLHSLIWRMVGLVRLGLNSESFQKHKRRVCKKKVFTAYGESLMRNDMYEIWTFAAVFSDRGWESPSLMYINQIAYTPELSIHGVL